jgi:hypothetical protein
LVPAARGQRKPRRKILKSKKSKKKAKKSKKSKNVDPCVVVLRAEDGIS